MNRLLVLVEGPTEETFINDVLAPYLYQYGYEKISPKLLGNARQRDNRGGIKPWTSACQEILKHLRQDSGIVITTMVDYYGLPESGNRAWPGRADAVRKPFSEKVNLVQEAICEQIKREVSWEQSQRFVPFIVMHEFESLLFSDCEAFARGISRSELSSSFQMIRNSFESPEEINDSFLTAPSKRIENLVPEYKKPLMGTLAAKEIGLEKILASCPHFATWVKSLESIPGLS